MTSNALTFEGCHFSLSIRYDIVDHDQRTMFSLEVLPKGIVVLDDVLSRDLICYVPEEPLEKRDR
jgi:hypothetical protein